MSSKLLTNYFPELSALVFGRKKPGLVTVNITDLCNQKCIYCETGREQPAPGMKTLSFADLVWIIDEMAKNKIRWLALCGGEPFLFKGIIDIVAYARSKKIRCRITTNGMNVYLLSESELNVLKECEAEINISIDSFENEINSYTRGSCNALSSALKSATVLMKKKIPVTVLTVISKYNYKNLFQFFDYAYETEIKQVLFQPVITHSNYPDSPAIKGKHAMNVPEENIDDLLKELQEIMRFEKKHKIKSNAYRIYLWIGHYLKAASAKSDKWFFDDVLKKFFCREVFAIIDISFYGGIQPCGLLPAQVFINENKNEGLMRLWLKATEKIRIDLRHNLYYPQCNGCCHHFSRNMFASMMKYPFKNRSVILKFIPLILSRIYWGALKKIV